MIKLLIPAISIKLFITPTREFGTSLLAFEGKKTTTLSLIFANAIFFLFTNVFLGEQYLVLLTQQNELVLEGGQWYRLFTSNWFHGDVIHLLSNIVGLFLFGVPLENGVKAWQYLAIYMGSGLIGSFACLFLTDYSIHSLGASGSIFGIMAAAFMINRRFDPAAIGIGLFFTAAFVAVSIGPNIDIWAHVFGAIGGLVLGYMFSPEGPEERYQDIY